MRRFFSSNLYLDGLRQLRVVGVTYLVILMISSIFFSVFAGINYSSYYEFTMYQTNRFLPIIVIIFAAIFTIFIFSFMNKRNASDVFFALPARRAALFFSYFAAVLSWMIFGIIVSSLLSILGFAVYMPDTVTLVVSTIPGTVLYYILTGFFISSIAAIAMSLTGTLFSNLAVFLLIAFAPRLFGLVFKYSLQDMLPIMPDEALPYWLIEKNNPIFYFFGQLVSGLSQITMYQIIYLLVLSTAYTAVAAVLFTCRKSETADKSAPNRLVQAVFRLTFSMLVCLIPCKNILDSYRTSDHIHIFYYVVFYTIALVVYFLYELITTHKVKNLLRIVPTLGVLVLMNLGFIGGIHIIRGIALADSPSAKDIASVRILDMYSSFFGYKSNNEIKNIRFDNMEVREIIAANLEESIQKIKQNKHDYDDNLIKVLIDLKGRTMAREFYISNEECENLMFHLLKNPDFKNTYKTLHDTDSANYYMSNNPYGFTEREIADICDTFRREVNDMEFDEWMKFISTSSYHTDYVVYGEFLYLPQAIQIISKNSENWYFREYSISSATPKTANKYMKLVNRYSDKSIISSLSNIGAQEHLSVRGYSFMDRNGKRVDCESYALSPSGQKDLEFSVYLASLYNKQKNLDIDITKPLWVVNDGQTGKTLYINQPDGVLPDCAPEGIQPIAPNTINIYTSILN